jgi:hypothetical protein
MPDSLAFYSRWSDQPPLPSDESCLGESVCYTNLGVHPSKILKRYLSVVPASPLEVEYGGRQEHWKRMEGFLRGRRRSRVAVHSTLDES